MNIMRYAYCYNQIVLPTSLQAMKRLGELNAIYSAFNWDKNTSFIKAAPECIMKDQRRLT